MENKHEVHGLKLWKLSWPLFVQLSLVYGILLTDSFFLSRISDNYVASIGAIFPVFCICYMLFNQVSQASVSVASQYIGGKKYDQVIPAYMTSVIIMTIIGFIVATAMLLFSDILAGLFGLSESNAQVASIYIKIVGSGLIFDSIKSAYTGILSSKGKTKLIMVISIIYNLVNILLNSVFVFGIFGAPKIGVYGICIATVFSQFFAIVCFATIVHLKEKIVFSFTILKGKFVVLTKQILNIGLPASIEPISVQLQGVVMNIVVIGFGMAAMAAKTYAFNMLALISAWSVSIGVGTLIIVAHSVGAKEYNNANKQLHSSIYLSTAVSFSAVLILTIFSKQICGIFTTDPAMIDLVRNLFIISAFCEPIKGVNIIVVYSLSSAGDSKYASIAGSIVMWVLGVPLCYILGVTMGLGLIGVWLGITIDELLRCCVYYMRWRKRKWEKTGVLAKEESYEEEIFDNTVLDC